MKEKRYAILIGCDVYRREPEKLPRLKCAENDAEKMKEVLANPKRGMFNDVKLFTTEPHHEISTAIEKILTNTKRGDLVLIYYSGHGRLDNRNKLHLATSDTEVSALATTSLPVDLLKRLIDNSSATKIVWILDCCYSGAIGNLAAGLKGLYIITSSMGFQVCQEKEKEPHSLFTKYLLKGLWGEADSNNDRIVTVEELYEYVHKKVTGEGGPEPQKITIGVTGDSLIARVPPPGEPESPYILGNKDLSLTGFPDVLTETIDDKGKINIAFVFGSGRYLISDHTSYGTDALIIPEITALLKDSKSNIDFSSCLDIDIYNTTALKNKNLFLIGSGKVNFVTLKLLERFGDNLKVKFSFSSVGEIFSSCHRPPKIYQVEKRLEVEKRPDWNTGILSLIKNPWAAEVGKQRIIVLVAGAHPIGTIAAMRLLFNYLKDPNVRANNKLDEKVPAKIVRGIPIEHNEYRQKNPFVTKTAGRTPAYIGNISNYEIIE
jgi:hypothetical protein